MTDHHATEITPESLINGLEAGEPLQVLDVRAPERLANGLVEPVPPERFVNRRGSEVMALDDLDDLGLDRSDPVVVVCGHGIDSLVIAEHLNDHGFVARSLLGGVTAWMRLVVARELQAPPGFDRLAQFDRVGKGALGYALVGAGEALVVDPPRDHHVVEAWVAAAGAQVVGVAETHVHADYLSGGPAWAAALGVPYYLHAADNVYPYDGTPGELRFTPLADGDTIAVGRARVIACHNPGHTEGSLSYLTEDAAITGDFLFINSVGRPDLAGKTEAWTGNLFASLRRVKNEWPPEMRILPAHYASDAERNPDRTVVRRLGELLESNAPLLLADAVKFRDWVNQRVGTPPEAYVKMKAINVGLMQVTDDEAEVLEAGKNECALG